MFAINSVHISGTICKQCGGIHKQNLNQLLCDGKDDYKEYD